MEVGLSHLLHFASVSNERLGFPGGSMVKNLPANAGDLGQEGSLDKEMATHSSTLAWKTP